MINLSDIVGGRLYVSRSVLGRPPGKLTDWPRPPTVVVWNATNACNLRCRHCYAASGVKSRLELSTSDALRMVRDISLLGSRILIVSGGEPLMRDDIPEVCREAKRRGLRVLVSTNGTLITDQVVYYLKRCGVDYVGVSLDGLGQTHDEIRGAKGSFARALQSLKMLRDSGIMTGVRMTVFKKNLKDVPRLIELLEEIGVNRFCLYHLVYSGRASGMVWEDISRNERKQLIDYLVEKALEWRKTRGEIETVAMPADGVYALLKLKENYPSLVDKALDYLRSRGGDPSATRLLNVDHLGNAHPNQFWWDHSLGNIRTQSLASIWYNKSDSLLNKLRRKHEHLRGRCGRCPAKLLCGGFRVRALRVYGDPWMEDPSCYLTSEEVKKIAF
jgi:radical SAM protein with 4Fe4S-binding SPASM domain